MRLDDLVHNVVALALRPEPLDVIARRENLLLEARDDFGPDFLAAEGIREVVEAARVPLTRAMPAVPSSPPIA